MGDQLRLRPVREDDLTALPAASAGVTANGVTG